MSIERKIFSGFLFIFSFVFLLTAWAYYAHFEKNLSSEQQKQATVINEAMIGDLQNTLLNNRILLRNLNSDGDLALAYDDTTWLAQIGIAKLKRKFDRIFENYTYILGARFYKNGDLLATFKRGNMLKGIPTINEEIELEIANSKLEIEVNLALLLQERMKVKQVSKTTRVYLQNENSQWVIDRLQIRNSDRLTKATKQIIGDEPFVVSECVYMDSLCVRTLVSFASYENSLNGLMARIGLLYVLVAFVILYLARKISRHIIKPLAQLQQATNRYIHGDYSPIQIEHDGEIANAINAFNDMGDRIKNFTTKLQEEVKARTQELEIANKKLEQLATKDSLTGLYNRLKIDEIVRHERERQKRFGNPFSIALVDIDNFKEINDNFGHLEGDRVLKEVAKRLRESIRKSDVVGRWGGEEFLIVLPQTEFDGAKHLAENINSVLKNNPIEPVGVISVSVGVAQYRAGEGLSGFFARTDRYLYVAKNGGKAQVVGDI